MMATRNQTRIYALAFMVLAFSSILRNPPSSIQLITCTDTNDALTHSDDGLKDEDFIYEWVADDNYGDVYFM